MTRIAGASILFAVLTLTGACGVGGDDPGSGTPIPPIDNSEVCAAAFTVTGTFAVDASTPLPTDKLGAPISGCWPVGTWTFTAGVDPNATFDPKGTPKCTTAPPVLSSYSFKVAQTTDTDGTIQTVTSTTTLSGGMQYHLAVSSNGQGCEASFEFGSADGTQYWNMKPTLAKLVPPAPSPTVLSGNGDYTQYKGNGWPWK